LVLAVKDMLLPAYLELVMWKPMLLNPVIILHPCQNNSPTVGFAFKQ
jgi:hypothetical protein